MMLVVRRDFKNCIYFEALKKMTSRLVVSIIGVDGCHLRGPHTRVLLTLVEILRMTASTLCICHSGGRKKESVEVGHRFLEV